MGKKDIRKNFRNSFFKRDNYTCRVCNTIRDESLLDAHHITDRSHGGYVTSNGITVCKDGCHMRVDLFHITNGESWEEGLHPEDLYYIIGSSREMAEKDSEIII